MTLVLCACAPPLTASAHDEEADVTFYSNRILFQPLLNGDSASLTVGCESGIYFERHYDNPAGITYAPADQNGAFPARDRCSYTLLVHPPVDPRITAAEEAGDDRLVERLSRDEAQRTRRFTGSFVIDANRIVAPNTDVEEWEEANEQSHLHE